MQLSWQGILAEMPGRIGREMPHSKILYDKMVTNLTETDLDYIVRIVENGLSRAYAKEAQARLPP